MKKIGLLLALALVGSEAFGVAEYYSIARSVRALGMGGAFYGLSDDENALWYNPAGLSVYRGGGRFNLLSVGFDIAPDTVNAVRTLSASGGKDVQAIADSLTKFQGDPLYGGVNVGLLSWMSKHFAVALINAQPKFNFAMLGRDLDTQVDVTGIVDAGIAAGYATSFLDDTLHIGLAVMALARAGGRKIFSLADIAAKGSFTIDPNTLGGAGAGVDASLGAIYELPLPKFGPFLQYHAGLSFNNLIATKFDLVHIQGVGKPPQLPRTMSIGFHTALRGYGPVENIHVLLDFSEFSLGGQSDPDLGARTGSFFKHVNIGIEAPLVGQWLTPRIGFHQGYPTIGASINLRVIKIDAAYYTEELAQSINRMSSNRFAFVLELGWGAPPPAITDKDNKKDEKKAEATVQGATDQKPPEGQAAPPVEAPKPLNEKEVPLLKEDGKGAKPEEKPTPPETKPDSVPQQKQDGVTIPKDNSPNTSMPENR